MYEGKRLYVSIGAMQAKDVVPKIKRGFTVIAYEPEKIAFEAYKKIEHPNFFCFDKAVSDYNGKTVLYAEGGNSAIVESDYKYPDRYEVDVVSLDSILDSITCVAVLHLNCEGAEIPILMGTSLKNLRKCNRIYVEFHAFAARCKVTDQMVKDCVQRLSKGFVVKDKKTYHPYFEFIRK